MNRLRLYMIVFAVLVSVPLAFVSWRTYGALDREARAQVRFFAERLLDDIEAELGDLVRREENRAVDEYRSSLVQNGATVPSPLARAPSEGFILGYFQNNPDGSFQTPLDADPAAIPKAQSDRVHQLQSINAIFNRRKRDTPAPASLEGLKSAAPALEKKEQTSFADRFIRAPASRKSKTVLGQQQTRVEEITAGQALNLAQAEREPYGALDERRTMDKVDQDAVASSILRRSKVAAASQEPMAAQAAAPSGEDRFQVEVAPLQAVSIDADRVFIFRRIGINGQIYRQGFVLRLKPFLDHLFSAYYDAQPISRYTRLTLNAAGLRATRDRAAGSAENPAAAWLAGRTFPAPFAFLRAEMQMVALPPSPARQTLTLALAILGLVMVAGLVAIYRSTRAVLDLSERRSRFVSAVTHELKTPLTNIRMYIEMLDQGIAATPEREQEYLGILASESARLSGLINNVLELSRLEKKGRRFAFKEGDLSDVLADVRSIMAEALAREGFRLAVESDDIPAFAYDRDVLVQILINLMENSIKFGRKSPQKRIVIAAKASADRVTLTVSDAGPGIPRRALKRVFDDFYRVDNDLARTTGGTGIGLSLVKKFVLAMGGRVWARNNEGSGCTIGISLPRKPPAAR